MDPNAKPEVSRGRLLELSEQRYVAVYVRDGVARVAEFNGGRAQLATAADWFGHNRGALAQGWAKGAARSVPLPAEVLDRIEDLHRRADARPTVIGVVCARLTKVGQALLRLGARRRGARAARLFEIE